MAKKVLITGGTGLIGSRLTDLMLQRGFEVSHLGRTRRSERVPSFVWNIREGTIDREALKDVNAIVSLAGSSVDKRWTASHKKEILDSRVQSTELLYRELSKGDHQVTAFVSASAIGYYGLEHGEDVVTEATAPGTDFLARVVQQWEAEVEKISSLNVRVVELRTGLVLSAKGGVLKAMAAPVHLGFGAALGSGKQYQSWIHIDDLCAMYIMAVEDGTMRGPYNAASVQPVTNKELTAGIARALNRPLWLPPIPGFVLRIILGEMANIVIYGMKVSPSKIEQRGFHFQFTEISVALKDLLGNS